MLPRILSQIRYSAEVSCLASPNRSPCASAQTHSKDSGTTIPWARLLSEPPRFHCGLHKGRRNLRCTFCQSQCTSAGENPSARRRPYRLHVTSAGGVRDLIICLIFFVAFIVNAIPLC